MQPRELPIEGYEGLYTISEYGSVKGRTGKPLKINTKASNGYPQIQLYKEGGYKTYLLHRLLAQAFIPNPSGKPHINHIDGNKHNNNLDNLEWVTHSENCAHARKFGLRSQKITKAGALMAKDLYLAGMKRSLIATLMGVSHQHMWHITSD